MRYMLLICGDDSAVLTDEQSAEMERDGVAWAKEMDERGVCLQGSRLRPVSEATTVRLRDAKVIVSDGPLAGRPSCQTLPLPSRPWSITIS
jgi:hypothetical protein